MTNKEAREILERLFLDSTNENCPTETYGSPYCCPSCGAEIVKVEFFKPDGSEPENKIGYCWKCGQALDWEDCEVRNEQAKTKKG